MVAELASGSYLAFQSAFVPHSAKPQTLKEAYQELGGDQQSDIPWLVRLLENPSSPLALPGKIDLYGHDYIHLLLNRQSSLYDEAFIVGFTMGNDLQTNGLHLIIFKVVSMLFYPQKYRFHQEHMKSFDLGFWYGRKISCKNINHLDFNDFNDKTISEVRERLGIHEDELKKIWETEQLLIEVR
jgi:hypothetical protein